MRQFVSVVLADTEDVWSQLFNSMGRTYDDPKLVLYSQWVNSACGLASAASQGKRLLARRVVDRYNLLRSA
jgi:predicted metalloprotease